MTKNDLDIWLPLFKWCYVTHLKKQCVFPLDEIVAGTIKKAARYQKRGPYRTRRV